jgi:hypothetical protein
VKPAAALVAALRNDSCRGRTILNAVAVAASVIAVAVAGGVVEDPPTPVVSNSVVPADRIVAAHDCWTGRAPSDMRGQLPRHVIVTREGRIFHSAVQVGPALEQIFEGTEHGLTVHAFCR